MMFQELNNDQRREVVNTRQRFDAWSSAKAEVDRFKGSIVWLAKSGAEYLVRSSYDSRTNLRRQKSLGPRSEATEKTKIDFERGRQQAKERLAELDQVINRQAAINRAVGIARMPLMGAKIIRGLDAIGALGKGIRIVRTNAIYAYEALAGVLVEPGLTTTDDIDLLFDARRRIGFASTDAVSERSLMAVLRNVDRSFARDKNAFRAVNRDGYLVDFIKPLPRPPWKKERETIAPEGNEDLIAAGIEGLQWLENASPFHSVVIDESGMPARMIAPDPRVFAVHKLWLAERPDRPRDKRERDRAQAALVAQLVSRYLTNLSCDLTDLHMVPKELAAMALPLFRWPPLD
jgi:hypothetical protein